MIDWWLVIRNAVWIVGAAILLWSWSYNRWRAISSGASKNDLGLWSGFLLLCIGQALIGGRWWEIAGWAALTVWSALQLRQSARAVI
jgi:hypothetical protein